MKKILSFLFGSKGREQISSVETHEQHDVSSTLPYPMTDKVRDPVLIKIFQDIMENFSIQNPSHNILLAYVKHDCAKNTKVASYTISPSKIDILYNDDGESQYHSAQQPSHINLLRLALENEYYVFREKEAQTKKMLQDEITKKLLT